MAGGSGANFFRFLLFDSLGALIWIVSYVFAGYVFSDQLELVVGYTIRMGSGFVIVIICLFAVFIWKLFQRRRFLKSINVDRISADELRAMLSAGLDVTIVDVRGSLTLDEDLIPGALRIPIEDLPSRHKEIPRDREIVLFCT